MSKNQDIYNTNLELYEKVVAAICVAPVTLANAGVLKDKKATVWHGEQGRLTGAGCTYTASSVEIDGSLITANGPTSAGEFGEAIAAALVPAEPAED